MAVVSLNKVKFTQNVCIFCWKLNTGFVSKLQKAIKKLVTKFESIKS